jgi:phage terminase small subunit
VEVRDHRHCTHESAILVIPPKTLKVAPAMKKKPEPAQPDMIPAPSHLSQRSQALWRELVPRRGASPGRLTLLQSALEALDRVEECRLAIAKQGMVSVTKKTGALHVNPLVKIEKESRALFLRAWSDLGLRWDQDMDGTKWT